MPRPPRTFQYDYDSILKLSDWPYNRLKQDVHSGELEPGSLESICLWASKNGKTALMAEMMANLMAHFKLPRREILKAIFSEDAKARKLVAKKRGRRA